MPVPELEPDGLEPVPVLPVPELVPLPELVPVLVPLPELVLEELEPVPVLAVPVLVPVVLPVPVLVPPVPVVPVLVLPVLVPPVPVLPVLPVVPPELEPAPSLDWPEWELSLLSLPDESLPDFDVVSVPSPEPSDAWVGSGAWAGSGAWVGSGAWAGSPPVPPGMPCGALLDVGPAEVGTLLQNAVTDSPTAAAAAARSWLAIPVPALWVPLDT